MLPADCQCFLINLDRSPDRFAAMLPRLAAQDITFERIPGVDGMALSEDEFSEQTHQNRYYKSIRRGEVGCQLSHLKALKRFLASGARYALVLEDDAEFDADFSKVLAEALALRERTPDPLLQWDVLKLNRKRRRYIDLAALGARHRLVEYGLSVPSTTTAAVWTRPGAERWVRAYRGTARPIDCDLQHPWEFGLGILSVHPPVVSAEDVVSAMGSSDRVTRNPWPKLRYELNRVWPRLRHFSRRYGWGVLVAWSGRRRIDYVGDVPDTGTP